MGGYWQIYCWGITLQWTRIGVEIFLVATCYRNQDKLWPDEPLGSNAD